MSNVENDGSEVDLGVVLFNLGGPETLADVRPFLYNLFSDPDIIQIKNDLLRRMVGWFIATTRQGKSRGLYRQIGGGSPLRKITEAQADALTVRLAELGRPAKVFVGMRCWRPTIDQAVEQIEAQPIRQLVVLPLFPQFSVTTTGSCSNYFRSLVQKRGLSSRMEIRYARAWFNEPLYVEAMAECIREAQKRFSDATPATIQLLYSAHSIPARYVGEGDPYQKQTEKTVSLINECLGNEFPSKLTFQSKVGPVKWLGPATKDVIPQLARSGVEKLLAVPVSFVSDHIETLQEIDILYRDLAQQAGIREFHRAPSLNLNPKFIGALANVVLTTLDGSSR